MAILVSIRFLQIEKSGLKALQMNVCVWNYIRRKERKREKKEIRIVSGSKSVQSVELLLIIFEMSENYEGNLYLGTFLFFHIIFFHVRKMRKPALRGDYFSLPLLHEPFL